MKDRLITVVLSVAATFGLMKAEPQRATELDVDRLVVRKELIVSDTGVPWEKGYERTRFPAASMRAPWAMARAACGFAAG